MFPPTEPVRLQLEAMRSDVFELGLFRFPGDSGRSGGEMIPRTWDQQTLLRSLAWLRFENRSGRNIYIRPKGEHHLSLIDDLSLAAVKRMNAEGFHPAVVVETSPGNFQAWVNHGERLPKDFGTAVARALATRFEGDTKAADWRHFGRLTSFTNQKPKHRQGNGLFPYVRLIESSGVVYPEAGRFLDRVREQHEREVLARRTRVMMAHLASAAGELKDIGAFRGNTAYGGDGTRVDLAYAIYALSHGVNEREVRAAIRSRDLSHKGSERRQSDYVERTIRKAWALLQTPARGR